MISPPNLVDLQEDIIRACSKHERENGRKPNYSRAFPFQGYFLKFGSYPTFEPEVQTLQYLADLSASDPSAPRVPRVLHYFYEEGGMAYVVMDLIQLIPVSPGVLREKTAQAVRWMRDVRAPDDVILGPKGGGPARHKVFKYTEAPLNYRSVAALERYFNKAVEIVRRLRHKTIADVSIADEPLVLTQSDMHRSNFGVDTAERPVILDPGQIGWLPESLGLFTLFQTTAFARRVAEQLFTPEEAAVLRAQPNLHSMAEVKVLLATAAGPSLSTFTRIVSRVVMTPSRRFGRGRQRDAWSTSPPETLMFMTELHEAIGGFQVGSWRFE
ncbi:hypothetical protein B0H12DRAFT_1033678 [Mycena haematopus]|nr:hypothetical protein B0H12DRAFT_1033678 [Mycena haematopus]